VRQAVTLVTLGVSEVAAARRFYVDGLGWTPVLDRPEVVFLQVGHGLVLGLFGRADLAGDATAEAGSPPGAFSLACNVDSEAEVDDAVARWVAAGGTVVKPAQVASFGGYHAYLADPDGFRWEVAHNPGLTVAEDGTVRFAPS
jgi:uncharacterized protein